MTATRAARHTVTLRDGSRVEIRAIRPADKQLLRDGFERLGPESRYRRFLTPMPKLTREQLAYLTEVDHHDHEALVAIEPVTGEGLGVARFVRDPQAPRSGEAAVTVVDDWHGRGLGTALLEAITERGRDEGIDRFTCLVLAENREMAELLERLGPVREIDRERGTVELAVDLPPADEGIGGALADVLRTAAAGVARFVAERAGRGEGADQRGAS